MLGTRVGCAAKKRVHTSLSRPLGSVDLLGVDLVAAAGLVVAFIGVVGGSVMLMLGSVRVAAGLRDVRVVLRWCDVVGDEVICDEMRRIKDVRKFAVKRRGAGASEGSERDTKAAGRSVVQERELRGCHTTWLMRTSVMRPN